MEATPSTAKQCCSLFQEIKKMNQLSIEREEVEKKRWTVCACYIQVYAAFSQDGGVFETLSDMLQLVTTFFLSRLSVTLRLDHEEHLRAGTGTFEFSNGSFDV